ncbi:hypothetical protein FNYG_13084 [Fusarium nygamai]|uniref:Uncharacterized protein n=1 Tax=Gibberella nygamai TaxID=42673 RepID=A0A2K0VU48_GIBNY|nr:hypothetical protein FNYG_13084 [Fusarium nygamai]
MASQDKTNDGLEIQVTNEQTETRRDIAGNPEGIPEPVIKNGVVVSSATKPEAKSVCLARLTLHLQLVPWSLQQGGEATSQKARSYHSAPDLFDV